MTGSLVSSDTRARVRELAVPIATALGRLGLTPNALTVIGFLGTCVAAYAGSQQAWAVAGILVLAFGIFDLFDGALARATNRVSAVGAFLDSTLDRAGELVVYLGLLWGTLDLGLWAPDILVAAAMAASTMVSYTRAKAESVGLTSGTGMAAVGFAPREVRLAILAVGLIVAGLLPGFPRDTSGAGGAAYPLAAIALDLTFGLIAILATITTVQRILVVARRSEPRQAKEG